jgi:hypothetical protein
VVSYVGFCWLQLVVNREVLRDADFHLARRDCRPQKRKVKFGGLGGSAGTEPFPADKD